MCVVEMRLEWMSSDRFADRKNNFPLCAFLFTTDWVFGCLAFSPSGCFYITRHQLSIWFDMIWWDGCILLTSLEIMFTIIILTCQIIIKSIHPALPVAFWSMSEENQCAINISHRGLRPIANTYFRQILKI